MTDEDKFSYVHPTSRRADMYCDEARLSVCVCLCVGGTGYMAGCTHRAIVRSYLVRWSPVSLNPMRSNAGLTSCLLYAFNDHHATRQHKRISACFSIPYCCNFSFTLEKTALERSWTECINLIHDLDLDLWSSTALPSLLRTDSMVSCQAPFLLSISVCFLVFFSFYWF